MVEDSNYEVYLDTDLENYKGKWIVICNEHIISSGDNVKQILEEASKKYPKKKFMLAKVPEEGAMIF